MSNKIKVNFKSSGLLNGKKARFDLICQPTKDWVSFSRFLGEKSKKTFKQVVALS